MITILTGMLARELVDLMAAVVAALCPT